MSPRYRVRFNFFSASGYYLTEWFDSYAEAWEFVERAQRTGKVHVHAILDENDEPVLTAPQA